MSRRIMRVRSCMAFARQFNCSNLITASEECKPVFVFPFLARGPARLFWNDGPRLSRRHLRQEHQPPQVQGGQKGECGWNQG
jgi:hypothetical protein